MDHKSDDRSVVNPVSDSEMTYFDLESEQLDFDHYIINISSDNESSIYDCNLDESFKQIKNDLEQLHIISQNKTIYQRGRNESSIVDDDIPDIDINARFNVMKDRIRNYRSKNTETETEALRKCITEINNMLARVTDNEGKT